MKIIINQITQEDEKKWTIDNVKEYPTTKKRRFLACGSPFLLSSLAIVYLKSHAFSSLCP